MSSFRKRFGLHWKGARLRHGDIDGNVIRILWGIVILLILMLAFLEISRNANASYRAARAERDLRTVEATLIDCLNGRAVWRGEDGIDVGCLRAETN